MSVTASVTVSISPSVTVSVKVTVTGGLFQRSVPQTLRGLCLLEP